MRTLSNTLIILSLLLYSPAQSGNVQPQYISPEVFYEVNGLPNNEVRCLLKDSKGYLWVGTTYGLAKYDGNKFSIYKHHSSENSISGDVISTIYEAKNGTILVGANGLSILEPGTGKWKNNLHNPNNTNSISNPSVTSIAQENDSIFWIITSNGLNRFNTQTGKFYHIDISFDTRIFASRIHSITPSKEIIFSASNKLFTYNIKENTYQRIDFGNEYNNAVVFRNYLVGIKSTDGNIFSLYKLNLTTSEETLLLRNIGINSVIFKWDDYLYVAHGNKVSYFDSNLNKTQNLIFQKEERAFGTEFNFGLRETNGTFWIGTNNGLVKIYPNSPFQFIDSKRGLSNEYIRSVMVDQNNNLWIGVRQGPLYRISNSDDFLLNRSPEVDQIKFPTINGHVFATNQILELKNGNLLLVTNNTLYHYNTQLGAFTSEFSIPNNRQFFSAVESEHGILIGSLERPTLFMINIENGRIRLNNTFKITNPLDAIYSLFTDSQARVWLGSEGFYEVRFDEDQNQATLKMAIPAVCELNYSSNSAWGIAEDKKGRLVVSTTNNGFYVFDIDTWNYKHFTKANGLASDFTCAVQKDINSNLWLSTKEGVTFINSDDYTMMNFPVKKGHYNSDFTFKSQAQTQSGFVLFGSKQGVVYFHPDSISVIDIQSPLYVNEFRVFDSVVKRELTQGDTIVLNHNENFFSFEFSLLDFRNPKEVSYRFQLIDYDRGERTVQNSFNSVSYTDVPPGNYTFRLSAYSTDYSERQTIDVSLIITPAFYQKFWFRLTVLLAIFIGLAVVIITIAKRQILRARLQKMELHLLRSQIDPHFIFNTLTSIQHTILTSTKDDAIDTLSRFSKLMRMGLDYSRLEYISLGKAINFYQTYVTVQSLNLDEKIDFQIEINEGIDTEKVKISPMLIQPFIENAIVHGLAPKNKDMKITLEISTSNGWLLCKLIDNGVGRKKASEIGQKKMKGHKSMGIEISRQSILMQLKKGRFIKESFRIEDNFDEQGNTTGTTVYLTIPYKD